VCQKEGRSGKGGIAGKEKRIATAAEREKTTAWIEMRRKFGRGRRHRKFFRKEKGEKWSRKMQNKVHNKGQVGRILHIE